MTMITTIMMNMMMVTMATTTVHTVVGLLSITEDAHQDKRQLTSQH